MVRTTGTTSVVKATGSGTYRVTTLERLDSRPKAVRILLGHDHQGNPLYYWLQTREFSPWTSWHQGFHGTPPNFNACQVDVRLQSSLPRRQGRGVWEYDADTYFFAGSGNELSGGQVVSSTRGESIIRIDTPFHDPYRGVLVEMLDCLGNLETRSTEVNLSVEFTELRLSPSIVAHYDPGRTTATIALANDGTVGVAVGSVSLGGRHPAAFSKDADECSNRMLGSGGVCVVTVSYLADAVEGNPDHHAILRISNDSVLAPELSVALFGEQAR